MIPWHNMAVSGKIQHAFGVVRILPYNFVLVEYLALGRDARTFYAVSNIDHP